MNRALVEASGVYPALGLVRIDEEGVSFDDADAAFSEQTLDQQQAAFSALYGVTIVILARLVGGEVAVRLAGGQSAEAALQGEPIGQ
jgi:hypothetical protein